MIVLHKIKMDLVRAEAAPRVDVVQDDKYCRDLEIHLYANGIPYELPENCSVLIRFRKADGKGGTYDTMPDETQAWSVSGNVVTVKLAPQVCTKAGEVMLWVVLLHEESELNSFPVGIYVHGQSKVTMESRGYTRVTGYLPQPVKAGVGQYIMVSQVDECGKITAVEAVRLESQNGKSAYELAVENGYDGTEEEWLESLKGEPGIDGNSCSIEVAEEENGYSLMVQNTIGNDGGAFAETLHLSNGKSAYAYAQDGGYTGTEEEFAAKLADIPLAGSTEEVTPSQVYAAIFTGQPIALTRTDPSFGEMAFNNFAYSYAAGALVISSTTFKLSGVLFCAQIVGSLASAAWTFSAFGLAQSSDIPSVLPNPNLITFKPGVNLLFSDTFPISYSGESAQTVYLPTKTSHLENDSGFVTEEDVDALITAKLAEITNAEEVAF